MKSILLVLVICYVHAVLMVPVHNKEQLPHRRWGKRIHFVDEENIDYNLRSPNRNNFTYYYEGQPGGGRCRQPCIEGIPCDPSCKEYWGQEK